MYTDAIACYTKALSQTQDADCYSSRAICYYNGTPKASANAYRDICEAMKSKDCPAYRLRALIYRSEMERKKGVKKGEAELDEMLSPYKGNKQDSNELGVICAHYGAVEHAIFYYERGLEHDPTNSTLHFNLALELKKILSFFLPLLATSMFGVLFQPKLTLKLSPILRTIKEGDLGDS